MRAHQSGDLQQAEACYRAVLASDRNNAGALYLLGVVSLQNGRPQPAIELFRQSRAIDDGNADLHADLGIALLATGQPKAALDALHRAVEIDPGHAKAFFHLGIALSESGDLEAAARALQESVRIEPRSPDVLMNLGIVLMQLGRVEDGLTFFRRAVATDPDRAGTRLNLAIALLQLNRLDEAEEELEKIAGPLAEHPDVAFVFGQLHERQRRPLAAANCFASVLAADPDNADAHLCLGKMLLSVGDLDKAELHTRRSLELNSEIPGRNCNLGLILEAAGRGDEAASCFRSAGQLGLVHLAEMFVRDGRFDQIQGVVDELRALNPDHPCIYTLASKFGHIKLTDADRRKAADIARSGKGDLVDIAGLHMALGRSHEKDGTFDAAFDYFRRANEMLSAGRNYDGAAEQHRFEAITDTFTPALFERLSGIGSDSDVPIFVVGMMRSGTTLVEQIIATHPVADGAGELNDLTFMQGRIREAVGGDQPYPDCIARIDGPLSRALAEQYLDRLRAVNPDARRVVDKMPHNFLSLGLIALLFPKARIVHCIRDPLDICFSIFQNHFSGHHPYAYALADIGHFHRLYERLMAHWRSVLPLAIHELRYEELIADPEACCRALIDFLGLDWDSRCLEFHKTERRVQTVSVWQVRQPLYSTAVGRWRNYDLYLDDLKAALAGTAPGKAPQ